MTSERFYIKDKDGDYVEAWDGILCVGGSTGEDICLPWGDIEIEAPDSSGVVFFNTAQGGYGVYLDVSQHAALLDFIEAAPALEDYHAAKHDQGKIENMTSERFYIKDKDGDSIEVKDGRIRIHTDKDHDYPLDAIIQYCPHSVHVDGWMIIMDEAQQANLRDFIEEERTRQEVADDYHAAKHDQGKPDPRQDLRLLLDEDFRRRTIVAAQALDENNPSTTWADLLDQIPHPHRSLGIGEAMHYGFQKYKKWRGWRDVPDALIRYQAAALRHYLFEKHYPEDAETGIDSESGIPHMSLAACNLAFVLELSK